MSGNSGEDNQDKTSIDDVISVRQNRVDNDVKKLLHRIKKASQFFAAYEEEKQYEIETKGHKIQDIVKIYADEGVSSFYFDTPQAAFIDASNMVKSGFFVDALIGKESIPDNRSNRVAYEVSESFDAITRSFVRENNNSILNKIFSRYSPNIDSTNFSLSRNGKKFLKESGLSLEDMVVINKVRANLRGVLTEHGGFKDFQSVRVAVGLKPV